MKNECPDYYKLEMYATIHGEDGDRKEIVEIECEELIRRLTVANDIVNCDAYSYGNVIKYLFRCGRKDTDTPYGYISDIGKAKDYCNNL